MKVTGLERDWLNQTQQLTTSAVIAILNYSRLLDTQPVVTGANY